MRVARAPHVGVLNLEPRSDASAPTSLWLEVGREDVEPQGESRRAEQRHATPLGPSDGIAGWQCGQASLVAARADRGSYVGPYRSPIGQVILVGLLSAYVATLIWMRHMALGRPMPRFLDARPGGAG